MGLDITWHRQITLIPDAPVDEGGYPEDLSQFCVREAFSYPERRGDLPAGIYQSAECYSFRAGGYSGYGAWRDELAKLAGYPDRSSIDNRHPHCAALWSGEIAEGPFYELINFSDCDGEIGATVSAKLAADFASHQEKADAHPGDWFREKYKLFRNAFEQAAQNGCVLFH